MSRTISSTFKEAIFAQETSEVPILLLTINHDLLATPIRLANNAEDVVSNGNTFIAYPMQIVLPSDNDEIPQAKIVIDNVSRVLTETVRTITTAPTVTIDIVLASDPDTIEATFENFELSDIKYDAYSIEGTLSLQHLYGEPFPGDTFSPAYFPGLF